MKGESDQPVCYVTTRGRVSGRKHTIEIWYVEWDGCIYLLSGYGSEADWVKNIRTNPQVTVAVAPDGRDGDRSVEKPYTATVGSIDDEEMQVRQAIEARYRGWKPGEPLSPWAEESLVVRLCPNDG